MNFHLLRYSQERLIVLLVILTSVSLLLFLVTIPEQNRNRLIQRYGKAPVAVSSGVEVTAEASTLSAETRFQNDLHYESELYESDPESTSASSVDIDLSGNGDVEEDQAENRTELIILWSRYSPTDRINWWIKAKEGRIEFRDCEWSQCELTRNRSRVREARVIVYRHYDPYPDWPEIRFTNQTYIHVLNERPNPRHWWLAKFDDKINITWNYRSDADVSHRYVARKKANKTEGKYVPRVPLANRTRSVIWAVSHCKTPSKRDEYAAELAKYIDVDVYGKCGKLTCEKTEKIDCAEMWARTYKFHLSFENTVCQDYITEKFYRPLRDEIIPIVLGGGDYTTVGPPHSYIDVRDYKSPKELAQYLHQLAQNEEEFNEYFQWKQSYKMVQNLRRMCKMCEIAHNMEKWQRPAHHDYYHWWMKGCDAEFMDRMRSEGNW